MRTMSKNIEKNGDPAKFCRIKGFDFYLFKLDDINIYNLENNSFSIVVSLEKSLE